MENKKLLPYFKRFALIFLLSVVFVWGISEVAF